jgi:hypothetical protein
MGSTRFELAIAKTTVILHPALLLLCTLLAKMEKRLIPHFAP